RRVTPFTPQKAVDVPIGITEDPYDLAGVVDAVGSGERGAGNIERGEDVPCLRRSCNAQTQPQGHGRKHALGSPGVVLRCSRDCTLHRCAPSTPTAAERSLPRQAGRVVRAVPLLRTGKGPHSCTLSQLNALRDLDFDLMGGVYLLDRPITTIRCTKSG